MTERWDVEKSDGETIAVWVDQNRPLHDPCDDWVDVR